MYKKAARAGLLPSVVVSMVLASVFLASSSAFSFNRTINTCYAYPACAAPTVTNVSPVVGPPAGGTTVVITGTGFENSTPGVKFGLTPAASFVVNSDTMITAVSPAHATGTVDVRVSTVSGQSAISRADKFTFGTPAWCATFNLSNVPTHWVQGHKQTFFVIVTNCGTKTWPFLGHTRVDLDLHFTTVRGGSREIRFWLSSIANHLHYNVPPGTKTKVTFTLTPLFHGGTIYLESLMVKEHSFWFDRVTSAPVQFSSVHVTVRR